MKDELTLRMLVVGVKKDGARAVPSTPVVPQDFRFIDLSLTSTDQKKWNRRIARSHAMKVVRGSQRRKRMSTRLSSRMSNVPSALQEEEIETIRSDSAWRMSKWRYFCSKGFAVSMEQGFRSRSLSLVQMENDLLSRETYSGRVTPVLHACIEHCKVLHHSSLPLINNSRVIKNIWPVFLPPQSPTELSPLAMDWFAMIRTSPALFHSSISFAGAHIDARESTRIFVDTPEIIAHKTEAIRQINLELSKDSMSDAVMLAIMSMARVSDETELEKLKREEIDKTSPFRPPSMPARWLKTATNLILEDAHFAGARTIIKLKGGLDKFSPCTAKGTSLYVPAKTLGKSQIILFYSNRLIMFLVATSSVRRR
jgi:hypothetical protein